jgi:hypothetical protein
MTPLARLKRSDDGHLSLSQRGQAQELEAAMEILEEMIRQRLEDRPVYELEFSLD